MRLKLTFVEANRRNEQKILREEVLEGESDKQITKDRAKRLIQRFHPEFRVMMITASEFRADWLVHCEEVGSNAWLYVYASKLEG